MSHSEIAGSKLAHSSPTLIAACHVLHRLYMPRHSPDALTSRLRAHTTNDNPENQDRPGHVVINSARYYVITNTADRQDPAIHPVNRRRTTASIKKPIHNVKEAHISGPYHRTCPVNRYSSSLENMASVSRPVPPALRLGPRIKSGVVEPIGIEPMT